jgi:hypothetical protein
MGTMGVVVPRKMTLNLEKRAKFKTDFSYSGKILCVHAEIHIGFLIVAVVLVSVFSFYLGVSS